MTEKRKLFDELIAGVTAMREQRERKTTLHMHVVEDGPSLTVDARSIPDKRGRSAGLQKEHHG